ncbi:MAG TPA: hypothetical protein VN947_19820 [Polyangia bacterium]|nr:hypothetical protein [Polyangia bacterium]
MRALVFLVLLCGVAHADASLPGMRAEPRWVVACEARLQAARDDAARILPIFRAAHVYGADLYLDENILGSDVPVLFEAGVLPTREPALVAYRLERWATRAQIARVMNDVFEPAVADCVREARAGG